MMTLKYWPKSSTITKKLKDPPSLEDTLHFTRRVGKMFFFTIFFSQKIVKKREKSNFCLSSSSFLFPPPLHFPPQTFSNWSSSRSKLRAKTLLPRHIPPPYLRIHPDRSSKSGFGSRTYQPFCRTLARERKKSVSTNRKSLRQEQPS